MNSLGQHAVSTDTSFIARLANIIPALIISTGIALVPNLPDVIVTIVRNVCSAFIVLTIALAIGSLLTLVNSIYERRPDAKIRPMKGYLQVVKIVIYAISSILIVAALIDSLNVVFHRPYLDWKSTRLNSSHVANSYDDFCFRKY